MKSYFDTLFAKIYLFKLPFYLGFQSNHYTVEIPNLLEVVPEIFTSMIRYNSLKTPNNISTQSKDNKKKPENKFENSHKIMCTTVSAISELP